MSVFIESDIVFVADMFLEEYGGGAERSTEALFETSPYKVFKCKSSEVNQSLIQDGVGKLWVFFNYRNMDHNLIPSIVANLNYMIVEYDYKFCQYRSTDLHKMETGNDCDCHDQQIGKIISAFLYGSEHIFWMSKEQSEIYHERFPFLKSSCQTVLSSIFSVKDLEYIESLYSKRQKEGWNKTSWAVIDGNSWIKGVEESVNAVKNRIPKNDVEVIGGLQYYDLLNKLSEYHGLSFHPLGKDTCPRTVIEAKLLGMQLTTNDNVQHKTESWFKKSKDDIEDYLLSRHQVFWSKITSFLNRDVKLSGYTQAYNVMKSAYPWRESISSLLGFCDEVVVLDGGSDDGTYEALLEWAAEDSRLVVKQLKRDWNSKRFALFNGQQKAAARTLCTGDWCWQVDIDEVVHEADYEKVKKLLKQIPKSVNLISLPVIEYWGGSEKVRVDINPWKWRLSKNVPYITHDVNADHRRYDEEGNLYSIGSDGDDYVHADTYQLIPDVNFYTPELHQVRMTALEGRMDSLKAYENFINKVVKELPGVHHYSWFDLKRKILSYKNFWSKHWASLYNKTIEDVPENNMFFNKKWSDVTDEEINDMSERMKKEMGGWIFHSRIDFDKPTPWIEISKDHPEIMKDWLEKHSV